MQKSLRELWLERRGRKPLMTRPDMTSDGLILGAHTALVEREGLRIGLLPFIAKNRMIAFLAVAGRGKVDTALPNQIGEAVADWARGDKALAAIRIALSPLPLLDEADAYRLFLAEKAFDVGLSAYDLLRELGWADTIGKMLNPNQPRVPAGQRTGGQFASENASADGASPPKSLIRPVLYTQPEKQIEQKPKPPFPVVPLPDPFPDGNAAGSLVPLLGLIPLLAPTIETAPAVAPPNPGGLPVRTRDREAPACPPEQADRPRGPNPNADAWESFVRAIVNPTKPTEAGQAYYLPTLDPKPGSDGRVSFDDCKRTDEPSLIPGLRKGDMVEMKNSQFNRLFTQDWSNALDDMGFQLKRQNDAVIAEGRSRRIFYCFDGKIAAEEARDKYG